MKAYALKTLIRQQGCDLQRIGRSRNWQLKANFEQIHAIINHIEQSNEPSWAWLAIKLNKEYRHLSHVELFSLATKLEEVTVNSLMAKSDCTIAQARRVIDELEGLD